MSESEACSNQGEEVCGVDDCEGDGEAEEDDGGTVDGGGDAAVWGTAGVCECEGGETEA